MSVTRRELCFLLPAMLAPVVLSRAGVSAERSGDENDALPSAMFPFEKLVARKSGPTEIRSVLKGKLVTGEGLEVHETTLAVGATPHAPHRHVHSEMWLIREGTVELMVEGKRTRMGPGSVGFVRSNEEHGIQNVGEVAATYFVVAVGPGSVA